MSTETTLVSPIISEITPLTPRPDFRLRRPRQRDDVTGELDGVFARLFSHRLCLAPEGTPDTDFYTRRTQELGYLYRRKARGGDAQLVAGSYGSVDKGGYMVQTRWAAKHLLHALSFLIRHGDWTLVTFAEPTATPPARLEVGARHKTRGRRPIQAPGR